MPRVRYAVGALIAAGLFVASASLWASDRASAGPLATPTPTATPTPLTTITNNTGQAAGFLHVQSFSTIATLPSVNAPGCGAPAIFGSGFEYWEIVWPSACVDPGESVSFQFGPSPFPPFFGYYWTASPPVVSAVNNTGLASDYLRIVAQATTKGATLVQNAPGCPVPIISVSVLGTTTEVRWSSACVAPGAKVSIHIGAPAPVTSAAFFWSPGTPTPTPTPTATPPPPVGGIAVDPEAGGPPSAAAAQAAMLAAALAAAATVVALGGAAWFARTRRVR